MWSKTVLFKINHIILSSNLRRLVLGFIESILQPNMYWKSLTDFYNFCLLKTSFSWSQIGNAPKLCRYSEIVRVIAICNIFWDLHTSLTESVEFCKPFHHFSEVQLMFTKICILLLCHYSAFFGQYSRNAWELHKVKEFESFSDFPKFRKIFFILGFFFKVAQFLKIMVTRIIHQKYSRTFDVELLTCFDHNSSKSTNFIASEVVEKRSEERDLSIGAESKKWPFGGFWRRFQPKKSVEVEVTGAAELRRGRRRAAATLHSLRLVREAVSTLILATKGSFCSIFRDLQDFHNFTLLTIEKIQNVRYFIKNSIIFRDFFFWKPV